jgi:hypothetical protein
MHFYRKTLAILDLLRGELVYSLKTDDSSRTVFDQYNVVVGFLAYGFFLRIVEPNAQGVPFAVIIDSQLFHGSFPSLMFFVK